MQSDLPRQIMDGIVEVDIPADTSANMSANVSANISTDCPEGIMINRGMEQNRAMMPGSMAGMPIGMGYVPWQRWGQTYPLSQGFQRGTIFPELDLPFVMGRCRG